MIGKKIQHFEITSKLGEGGMGEVFVATDTRLDRQVALKFLPPHYSQDTEFKARFEHEAKAAAALNHPNIITVYDLGEHEGRNFIVMELIEGETLEAKIKSGDLTLSSAVDIAQQMCEGLGSAHEAGIIHRDIKPANIFIGKQGQVKILDFGLAKSRRATTETKVGTTVGTIQYESPEQSRGENVDQRSDLFSLGVLLYEMVTSQRPFRGEFEDSIRYAIANDTPDPMARYKSDVSEDLQRIVSKLLEKDPELRYQTAAGVGSDLKLLRRSSGPHASSVHKAASSTTRPTHPTHPKRKLLPIIVPTGIGIAVLVLALVFKPWNIVVEPIQVAEAAEDRLAIMYFDNLTDPDDVKRDGEVVSSLLISDLAESSFMKVVSTQRLYDILKNLGREGVRKITPDVATEIARKAKARWMLTGKILRSEPNWVISAELSEVSTGNLLASPTITGRPGEAVFDVVDRLTREIKSKMALPAEALAELDKPVIELTTESSDAYRLYLEGKALNRKFMPVEAEQKFRQALEIDSTFASAYQGLAFCRLVIRSDFLGALSASDRAMEHIEHATDRDARAIRGLSASLHGHAEEARQIILGLIKRYPTDKAALRFLARSYQSADNTPGHLERSIAMYKRIIEIDPIDLRPYNGMAYVYDEMGDIENSIKAINKYIEFAPGEHNPYDSRGELQAKNGQFEAALASYRVALEIKSDYLPSLTAAIGLYTLLGNHAKADELVQTMLEHESSEMRTDGQIQLFRQFIGRGKFQEGLDILQEAIGELDDSFEGLNAKGSLHMRRAYRFGYLKDRDATFRELAAARAARTKATSTTLANQLCWDDEIIFHARFGDIRRSDSIAHLWGALIGTTGFLDSANYWTILASCRFESGNSDSALVYYHRAGIDNPGFTDLVRLARMYAASRQVREAVRLYEQALTVFDGSREGSAYTSVVVHYWLGQAYETSGKTGLAIEQYQEFLELWKDADPGLEDVEDARRRLAALQS